MSGANAPAIDLMQKLSPSFRLSEFVSSQAAARHNLDNTPPPQAIAALQTLCVEVLQPVRDHFGRPVIVSSGYRSALVNAAVGGSSTSQHMLGEAADIEIPGVSNYEVAKWIYANAPFDQVILEFYTPGQPSSGWVHVSYRVGRLRQQALTITRAGTFSGLRS